MQRPTSVTVFGILNLIFGVWGLLGLVFVLVAGVPEDSVLFDHENRFVSAYLEISTYVGYVATGVLIVAGIGLLALKTWGRLLSIGYAVYAILGQIVSTAVVFPLVVKPMLEEQDAFFMNVFLVSSLIGVGFGLLYPCLLLFFMTRRHVIRAFNPPSGNFWEVPDEEPVSRSEQVLESVIPTKNGAALASYYLGLFSLFPLLGLPLAVAAVVLGNRGLRSIRMDPELPGKAHAWVGIVCGTLFGFFNGALVLLLVYFITQK